MSPSSAGDSKRGAFVVGIDLGTSNTVVAYADLRDPRVELFEIEQRSSRSETASSELFPSVAFGALEGDVADATLPGEAEGWVLGAYARKRGVEVPSRLVTSAKSWLCHPTVDKVAPILPWGQDDVPKLSPFDATSRYLAHVRHAWNAAHPGARLEHQHVVLTVPASFNEVARELTVRAAKKAGLAVRLLEEPQAAFYSAIRPAGGGEGALADHDGDAIALVADVGGGTTDLSLIRISGARGALKFERVAVGSHLLLGGDNMDLALAHALEPRLTGSAEKKLEPKLFAELVVQCKEAKERLLAEDGDADAPTRADGARSEVPIALAKRGSSLVGSVMRATLTRDEVESLVFDGFFPRVGRADRPQRARSALVGFGLPYERDPAITRHVAAFLGRHLPEDKRLDYILFNGGVFRGASTRARFAEIVGSFQDERAAGRPRIMGHADPDRAVARGAAVFGLSLLGRGPRIEGGSARAYFIGLGRSASGEDTCVCVLAKGAEEGRRTRLEGRTFKLLVGREVRFDLLSSDTALATRAGDIVKVTDDLERLPALATKIPSQSANEVDVEIEAELTAVGTLEVACVRGLDGETRRYQLAFDVHRDIDPEAQAPRSLGPRSLPPRSIRPPGAGVDLVQRAFSKEDPRDAKSLLRDLEKALGDRPTWTLDASRALADALLASPRARRATPEHERTWLLLAGYCMRPGFGAPGDAERIAKLVPVFAERVAFPKEARSWQQFFVAFRRVAGGLIESTQLKMRDELDGFVAPSGAQNVKKPKGAKPEAKDDLLDLLSHLERVPRESRAALGGWLLEKTWTDRDPRLWAAIGRVGARVPAYASVHHVVAIPTVEKWIDHLLREKWAELPTAFRAAADLARRTDDRSRDISETLRADVAKRLEKEAPDPRFARVVRDCVPIGEDDRVSAFGEALPVGLRIADA
ncbi:MAG: Hsp70 family protein [Polyangiaceae bacterium]